MAKHVHFLGIGGSGASAAAAIAEAQEFEVSGCDLAPHNEFTTQFNKNQLLTGHNPKHLGSHPGGAGTNVDILAITPAITSLDPDNSELREARKLGIEVLTWQEFTGKYLQKDKFVIAVCGTHGKTTTTAMIAGVLEDAGLDPTVILGAIVPSWGANYRISNRHSERGEESQDSKSRDLSLIARDDKKEYFVIEADEYNDNFLPTHPDISVVTNIEMDHPEYFRDFDHYKDSFKKFLAQTKGPVIEKPKKLINFPLQIPGEFNRSNASQAFEVGLLLNIDPEVIKKSLQNYTGVGRRFELLGQFNGAKVYTDFGHHPTEIKTTMQAAREKFPKRRIWLIYEPHMFTRTLSFFDDFVKVFREIAADRIIITDIYQSREVDKGLVTSQQLADAVSKENISFIPKKELTSKLVSELRENDVIFFMGAGDIDRIAKDLLI